MIPSDWADDPVLAMTVDGHYYRHRADPAFRARVDRAVVETDRFFRATSRRRLNPEEERIATVAAMRAVAQWEADRDERRLHLARRVLP